MDWGNSIKQSFHRFNNGCFVVLLKIYNLTFYQNTSGKTKRIKLRCKQYKVLFSSETNTTFICQHQKFSIIHFAAQIINELVSVIYLNQEKMLVNFMPSYCYYYLSIEGQNSIPPIYMSYEAPTNIYAQQHNSQVHQENHECNRQPDQRDIVQIPQHKTYTRKTANCQKGSIKKKRSRKISKKIESAKKNSEGNLTNQLFSFLKNRIKSQKHFHNAIKLLGRSQEEEKSIKFALYAIIEMISNKKGRKYANKSTIMKYFQAESFIKSIPRVASILEATNVISLEDICKIIRITSFQYVRSISPLQVLISKKIMIGTKKQHLRRRRVVIQAFTQTSN